MGKICSVLGITALGLVGFFGLQPIFALILIPISSTVIENKGWAGITAIFGGAVLGVGLPRLYVKWLDRTTHKQPSPALDRRWSSDGLSGSEPSVASGDIE